MANGFVTTRPAAATGTIYQWAARADAGKFTCGGTGTQEAVEIGMWAYAESLYTPHTKLAIFEDDAANGCPGAMVANSESDDIGLVYNGDAAYADYHTYVTKPALTGGTAYWIGMLNDSNKLYFAVSLSGGTALQRAATYATWPTDTEWHTHTDTGFNTSLWVVYQAVSAGVALPVLMNLQHQFRN
jgi:hypothetical protein